MFRVMCIRVLLHWCDKIYWSFRREFLGIDNKALLLFWVLLLNARS